MKICKTKTTLRTALAEVRAAGNKVALVPTMGALHAGHLQLLEEVRDPDTIIVCSIFVNPTQFNDPEDLKKYPRPLERDIELLTEAGCDILFLPEVDEMYQPGETWYLELGQLDRILEGAHRPGHFQGVTQIVHKLFDLVQPDIAVFGQKDLQQFQVIRTMVEQLELPVILKMAPTMREASGLAMSSRNVRLNPEDRENALALYKTLRAVREDLQRVRNGEATLPQLSAQATRALQEAPGIQLEYFDICRLDDLQPAELYNPDEQLVALVAARVGEVRLIDNLLL